MKSPIALYFSLDIEHQAILSDTFIMQSATSFLVYSLLFCTYAAAKTVTYDWSVGYVSVNPDGAAQRQAIGINGKWYAGLLSSIQVLTNIELPGHVQPSTYAAYLSRS